MEEDKALWCKVMKVKYGISKEVSWPKQVTSSSTRAPWHFIIKLKDKYAQGTAAWCGMEQKPFLGSSDGLVKGPSKKAPLSYSVSLIAQQPPLKSYGIPLQIIGAWA